MRSKILIVGGYGLVGGYATLELVSIFPNNVIIAGRDLNKATSFAQENGNLFKVIRLDIYDIENIGSTLNDVKIIVMCLSPKNNEFAKYCINNGIHYVDISPSNEITKSIEDYNNSAKSKQSTCILGVGLAPGLSNLLVKKLHSEIEYIKYINIFLMLGLGEAHGKDGISWNLDNLKDSFLHNGISVKPFIKGKKAVFPQPLGQRKSYPFNLADQFIIPKTLRIQNVQSYFTYDSKIMTSYIHFLKRIGIFGLLRFKKIYNIMLGLFMTILKIFRKFNIGTDIYCIKIEGTGLINDIEYKADASAMGYNNSLFTARIASLVAEKLLTKELPYGVYYLEELFSLEDLEKIKLNIEINIEKK